MAKKYGNFLIVGTQRTGSSVLAETLDNSRQIVCGWEWTQQVAPWKQIVIAKQGLDGVFTNLLGIHQKHMERSMDEECRWIGFRRLFRSSNKWLAHPFLAPALFVDRLEGHIRWLQRNPQIKIIHVVRVRNIEWLKSKYVAKAAKSYIGSKYPEELKVVIPVDEAITRLQSKEWVDHRLASLNDSNRYIRVCYEDFVSRPDEITNKLFGFFGVAFKEPRVQTSTQRQSKGAASDYIANYTELLASLSEAGLLMSSLK